MNDLIERLETAPGPDRELANEVLLACGWKVEEEGGGPDRKLFWVSGGTWDYPDGDQPNPLDSVDAALALIAEGHHLVQLRHMNPTTWYAEVGDKIQDDKTHEGEGRTGAHAVSIAALKARLITAGQETGDDTNG